ncbi:MAG: hypothetical protein WBD55_04680 [Dehalococcoidia bacterium]
MARPPSKFRLLPVLLLIAASALVILTVILNAVLDSNDGWTQAVAAVGVVAIVIAVSVLLATAQGWANGTRLSLAAITTAVVGFGALGLTAVTYLGGASDLGADSTNVSQSAPKSPAADAQASQEGIALSQQESHNEVQPPGYSHDVGSHPTFNEFISMDDATVLRNTPGGTLLPNEVDLLRQQLTDARAFAETVDTVEKARAAGFNQYTNDVPFMGAHFLNMSYVMDGVFDPGKPEGLLFSQLGDPNGEWTLVGVWYLLFPGINSGVTASIPPDGFAGNLELWHEHNGLCTRAGIISENNTADGCAADNGNFIGDLRWMMHVWVWPEVADNPEGVFTYLNANLYDMQQANVQGEPLGGRPLPD